MADEFVYALGIGRITRRSGGRGCGGDGDGGGDGEAVFGPAYAFTAECSCGEALAGLEESHGVLHQP